ncbi:uncharacterized protein LOC118436639 isoform X1 [Folsomia candida]|uniref:uncharacterized protein LOC118436639 isoform X1 n=1 Tax=Folsomia candida TaxID=158441 RepID=UPI0016053723|nr:uncharacterized protein LOC118436639 isoform X1 [Folsomia candida]XP_035711012.1 uncharacterized protein LOC118436639 isoform X1 [Folsomia candida]XP_035711013.1 uncharacterized protein LOC118436639 isoform X1 [Folsomia candida]XP_035711014.1 uncharacterized protein LOC118436639 isoform X1 [Folsomia candida]
MNTVTPRTELRRRRKATSRILQFIRSKTIGNTVPTLLFSEEIVEPPVNVQIVETEISSAEPSDFVLDNSQVNVESDINFPLLLPDSLRLWATAHNVTHMCLRELITIINPHINNILPLDPRTLMKTPRQIVIEKLGGGELVYFGIKKGVERRLKLKLSDCNFPIIKKWQHESISKIISISVGIDGVPISQSNTKSFWPILGMLDQAVDSSPFIIGLFCGMSKPKDTLFLKQFVDEALELERTGILFKDLQFAFKISCIIADAPARSFIKGCKQHNSYNSCERCEQEGEWLGRVILRETVCPQRTDDKFIKKTDADHHTYDSELLRLNLGLVSQIVLDHMHLVFLGVTKKLLNIWVKGKLPHRLSSQQVLILSRNLIRLRPFVSRDFQRKPRGLDELNHFKATEFRLFLLYSGIAVLGETLPLNKFKNFLKLQAAMSILLSPNASIKSWNDVARSLLIQFVKEVELIYGPEFMIYNVHSIIHICDDALNFGNLSRVSAFPFESYMQKLKSMLHAKNYHLNQVAKRLQEIEAIDFATKIMKSSTQQFSNSKYDNCFYLGDGTYVILKYINLSIKYAEFYEVIKLDKFPEYPFNSLTVNIFLAKITTNVRIVNYSEVMYKCLLLPYKNMYLCLPLLHTLK